MSDEVECKCPDGIPAWVMTFADLMSLLLAFFVLLFSFSSMDVAIYKELAGSLKDAFGVQREIKAKETPRGINIIAREFSPGRPVPTPINEVRQMTTNESKMHPVFTDPSKDGQENQSKKSDDAEDKKFNAMQETKGLTEEEIELLKRINEDSKLLRESFDSEINEGLVEVKITQTRIIIMVREKGSFPSGSAEIIKPFEAMVTKISKVFSEFEGKIIVTGHTDNIPINTYRFRSNWELSSSRAVSVIHALAKDKVLSTKEFEIAAYADTKPIDSNSTYEGRAKNRRVEIMMDYSRKSPTKDSVTDTATNAVDIEPNLMPEDAIKTVATQTVVDSEL